MINRRLVGQQRLRVIDPPSLAFRRMRLWRWEVSFEAAARATRGCGAGPAPGSGRQAQTLSLDRFEGGGGRRPGNLSPAAVGRCLIPGESNGMPPTDLGAGVVQVPHTKTLPLSRVV